ncbi:MAG: hypothetical protein JWM40_416 [Frankiales bacterium]|nr:hypothetical protein [Frankiales bacterium]
MRVRGSALLVLAALLSALTTPAFAAPQERWFSAWSRPQSVVVGAAADSADGGRGPGPLVRQSVRDIVRVTGAGSAVRVRLSNRYGASLSPGLTLPLTIPSASIARRRAGADVVAGTLRTLTFAGRPDVTIPAGGTVVSDPVALPVSFGDDLAISLYVGLVAVAPSHGASFVTSYVSPLLSGDHTRDVAGGSFSERTFSTLVLTGIDVRSSALRGVIATTGGSVTDGFGTEIDSHTDFPSWLSRRVHTQRTVVNNGLGGTTASTACAVPGTGPSVQERVGHDSLSLPGVTHLIVYAGTNDLGSTCGATEIIAAFRSIVRQAHARGVRVLISTITPRQAYSAATNAEREKVNAWVRARGRCGGQCDTALDFDAVIRDPADHNRIDPRLDSGDGIHPTGEGYRRIAASIPLAALV